MKTPADIVRCLRKLVENQGGGKHYKDPGFGGGKRQSEGGAYSNKISEVKSQIRTQ